MTRAAVLLYSLFTCPFFHAFYTVSASITKITVEFRFSRENLQLFFGVWTDTCYEYSVTAQLSKSIEGSRKFPQISVPVYGILKLHINPTFYWNGHGNAVGTIRYTEALQNGIIANISTTDINFDASSQWLQYGHALSRICPVSISVSRLSMISLDTFLSVIFDLR